MLYVFENIFHTVKMSHFQKMCFSNTYIAWISSNLKMSDPNTIYNSKYQKKVTVKLKFL
jgi:hypothetical protein